MLRLGEKKIIINNEGDFPLYFEGKLGSSEQALYEGFADPVAGRYNIENSSSALVTANDPTVAFNPGGASGAAVLAAAKLKVLGFGEIYKPNLLRVLKTTPYTGFNKTQDLIFSLSSGTTPLVGSEIAFRIAMRSNRVLTEYVTFFNDGVVYQYRTIQVIPGDTIATITARFAAIMNNLQMGEGMANPLFKVTATTPFTNSSTLGVVQLTSAAKDIDFRVDIFNVSTSRYSGLSVGITNILVTLPYSNNPVTISPTLIINNQPGFFTNSTSAISEAGFTTIPNAPTIAGLTPPNVEEEPTLTVTVNSTAFTFSTAPDVPLVVGMLVGYTLGGNKYYNRIATLSSTTVGTFTSVSPVSGTTSISGAVSILGVTISAVGTTTITCTSNATLVVGMILDGIGLEGARVLTVNTPGAVTSFTIDLPATVSPASGNYTATATDANVILTGIGTTDYNEGINNFGYLRTQVFETEGNVWPYSSAYNPENRQVPIGINSLFTSYILDYQVIRPGDGKFNDSLNGQNVGYFSMQLYFNSANLGTSIIKLETWLNDSSLNNKRWVSLEPARLPVNIGSGTYAASSSSPYIQ